jgi:TolB-like protein/Tfp pilus assembly protein PilF/class 3 adenylate cyclase
MAAGVQSPTNELASVLFMDIVSYSLGSIDDQTELLTILQQTVRESVEYKQASVKRELISLPTGDGMALVFLRDPVSPVKCALEIAASLKDYPEIKLRMGIHQGPVRRHADIKEDANVVGGGINIAQRVMDFGDAGHILLSRNVAEVLEQLRGWSDYLQDLGVHEAKHGVRVHLYNLYKDGLGNRALPRKVGAFTTVAAEHANERLAAAGSRGKWPTVAPQTEALDSIAVLPLVNAYRDADTDYLCDGITESLINSLSEIPNLRVVPRSTVFRFKAAEIDLERAVLELNARVLLTGRIFQRHDTLNVQAELVDAAAGAQLWGQKYNRKLTDISVVEEEIAREIVSALRVKLNSEEKKRFGHRSTDSGEAYQLFLKGRYLWNKRTREGLEQAIKYFRQAIDRDPSYALAYAGMADCYAVLGSFAFRRPQEVFPLARAAAKQAIEIDEGLAEAYVTLAIVSSFFDVDRAASEVEFQQALKLNPNYAVAHQWYGAHLCFMTDFQQGLGELQEAQRLEPLSPMINVQLGVGFYFARQYEEATRVLLHTIEFEPTFWPAHYFLGTVYAQQGDQRAMAELEVAAELSGRHPLTLSALGRILAREGRTERAEEMLVELSTRARKEYVSPTFFATIHLELGDKNLALERLQDAVAERSPYSVWLKVEPSFDALRVDARFMKLIERVFGHRDREQSLQEEQ